MQLSRLHILGLIATSMGGCAKDVDSTDVRTSGMYADLSATSRGDGQITVEAKIRVGGSNSSTYAELDGEDRLIASLHGEARTMAKSDSGPSSPYRAVFFTTLGGTLTISFQRGALDTSAPDSRIILPDAFSPEFVGISPGDSVQRGQPVAVAWDSISTGPVLWQLRGACIKARGGNVIDEGKLVLRGLDIEPSAQLSDPAVPPTLRPAPSCDVTLSLQRGVSGYVDPAFREGGSFQASQTFNLSFRSTPGPDEPKLPALADGGGAIDVGAAIDAGTAAIDAAP
jgi:hypothetical protein